MVVEDETFPCAAVGDGVGRVTFLTVELDNGDETELNSVDNTVEFGDAFVGVTSTRISDSDDKGSAEGSGGTGIGCLTYGINLGYA